MDALIAEHGEPILVKIDVEGHEAEVVKGLTRTRPSLFFEVNRESSDRVFELLAQRGYTEFLLRLGEQPHWLSPSPVSADAMRERIASAGANCDCLALSPDGDIVRNRRPGTARRRGHRPSPD
jgi:hypothetical protein